MPYFVYRISEPRSLEHIDTFDNYKKAREVTRNHRAELGKESKTTIRMIFANNQVEAEKLLLAPREERQIGEE